MGTACCGGIHWSSAFLAGGENLPQARGQNWLDELSCGQGNGSGWNLHDPPVRVGESAIAQPSVSARLGAELCHLKPLQTSFGLIWARKVIWSI